MSPNNGILFNGVLIPKQLNNPFDPCFFIRFDILLLHTAPFDDNIVVPFLFYRNFESTFSVSFLTFKEYINMFYKTNFIKNPGTVIFHSLLYFFLWNKDTISTSWISFNLFIRHNYVFWRYTISVFFTALTTLHLYMIYGSLRHFFNHSFIRLLF